MTTYHGSPAGTPSTYYATTSLVKAYLGISGSGDNTLILSLLARAHAAIDNHCARRFQAASNTNRYFDPTRDVDGRTLKLDYDLCSINSITNGDGVGILAASYVTEPRNTTPYHAITLLGSKGLYWTYTNDPENAITVSGKWAYSASAPDDIVQACVRLSAFLYRQKDAQIFETTASPELGIITVPQALPRDVVALLAPYRRVT